MSWNLEREERLRTLWTSGLSASQVAAELGPWCTRSAVLGKVHRLGLADRATVARAASVLVPPSRKPAVPARNADAFHAQQKMPRAKIGRQLPLRQDEGAPLAVTPAVEAVVIPISERVALIDLQFDQCRWPFGNPQDEANFGFCGRLREDVYSDSNFYCAHHARVAHVPGGAPRKQSSDETRAKMRAAHVKRGSTAWRPA